MESDCPSDMQKANVHTQAPCHTTTKTRRRRHVHMHGAHASLLSSVSSITLAVDKQQFAMARAGGRMPVKILDSNPPTNIPIRQIHTRAYRASLARFEKHCKLQKARAHVRARTELFSVPSASNFIESRSSLRARGLLLVAAAGLDCECAFCSTSRPKFSS